MSCAAEGHTQDQAQRPVSPPNSQGFIILANGPFLINIRLISASVSKLIWLSSSVVASAKLALRRECWSITNPANKTSVFCSGRTHLSQGRCHRLHRPYHRPYHRPWSSQAPRLCQALQRPLKGIQKGNITRRRKNKIAWKPWPKRPLRHYKNRTISQRGTIVFGSLCN